jgi:hypothetical protein
LSTQKKTLIYILPSNLTHEGIGAKIDGQCALFKKKYKTTLIKFEFKSSAWPTTKLVAIIYFHIRVFFRGLTVSKVYYRYNPKVPIINAYMILLSFLKPVYLENNGYFNTQLKYLNKFIERTVHLVTYFLFRFSHIQHMVVHFNLIDRLTQAGIPKKRVTFLQNGYTPPQIKPHKIDKAILEQVAELKVKNTAKLGIFVGKGSPWHGVNKVIDLFQGIDSQLLVVGPYAQSASLNNVHYLGNLNRDTLLSLYGLCDFGIGTFDWGLLGISEGCPLKTREYLCFGLPILVNYKDWAQEISELSPFIYDYSQDKAALGHIVSSSHDAKAIVPVAIKHLNWNQTALANI